MAELHFYFSISVTDPGEKPKCLDADDFTPAQVDALAYIIANRGKTPTPPAHRLKVTDQVAPKAPVPNRDRVASVAAARAQGYTGNFCTHCQSTRTRQNGSCLVCEDCGNTTGCS